MSTPETIEEATDEYIASCLVDLHRDYLAALGTAPTKQECFDSLGAGRQAVYRAAVAALREHLVLQKPPAIPESSEAAHEALAVALYEEMCGEHPADNHWAAFPETYKMSYRKAAAALLAHPDFSITKKTPEGVVSPPDRQTVARAIYESVCDDPSTATSWAYLDSHAFRHYLRVADALMRRFTVATMGTAPERGGWRSLMDDAPTTNIYGARPTPHS